LHGETVPQKQTGSNGYAQQGVVIPPDQFASLADGPVIDRALITDSNVVQLLHVCGQVEKKLEQARFRLVDCFLVPPIASSPPDRSEHFEYLRLRDRMCRKKPVANHPPAGIVRRPPAAPTSDRLPFGEARGSAGASRRSSFSRTWQRPSDGPRVPARMRGRECRHQVGNRITCKMQKDCDGLNELYWSDFKVVIEAEHT
jgi:hypothetical protein